jgi:hypothetical protein
MEFLMPYHTMAAPIISPVIPNPTTTTNTVSSMGVQGLPMSSALPIIVNESTPNLAEIQSFPVVVRNGGIHIHQDPVSGQRYRMTDEFHSRIPQILAGNSSTIGMTGGVMPISADDVKIISDNIENFSTILVTESTPNLSEILSYSVYDTVDGYTIYRKQNTNEFYVVSDNLKEKSSIILQIGSGRKSILALSEYLLTENLESGVVTTLQDTTQIRTGFNVIINQYSVNRFAYPTLTRIQQSTTVQNIRRPVVNRFTYPRVR